MMTASLLVLIAAAIGLYGAFSFSLGGLVYMGIGLVLFLAGVLAIVLPMIDRALHSLF